MKAENVWKRGLAITFAGMAIKSGFAAVTEHNASIHDNAVAETITAYGDSRVASTFEDSADNHEVSRNIYLGTIGLEGLIFSAGVVAVSIVQRRHEGTA